MTDQNQTIENTENTNLEHFSVMAQEVMDLLQPKSDGIYVDGTLGRAGHSSMILERIPQGHLYAFDLDQQAIDQSEKKLSAIAPNFTLIHQPYQNLQKALQERGVEAIDGLLLDLGVSSPQFDDPSRGFSYRHDARLDMRMDTSQPLDAWQIVNTYPQKELERILRDYGEESFARPIAKAIVKSREEKPIDTTFELVDIIKKALPAKVLKKKGHPAKQTFQALRIEVNHELEQLESILGQAFDMLKPGGRVVIITFHSLEDRMVKKAFAKRANPPKVDKRIPVAVEKQPEYTLLNKKPILAQEQELQENRRSHSAKLRGIQKNEPKER